METWELSSCLLLPCPCPEPMQRFVDQRQQAPLHCPKTDPIPQPSPVPQPRQRYQKQREVSAVILDGGKIEESVALGDRIVHGRPVPPLKIAWPASQLSAFYSNEATFLGEGPREPLRMAEELQDSCMGIPVAFRQILSSCQQTPLLLFLLLPLCSLCRSPITSKRRQVPLHRKELHLHRL